MCRDRRGRGPGRRGLWVLTAIAGFLLAACEPPPVREEGLRLTALSFDDITGWSEDDHAPALLAFRRSCGKLTAAGASQPVGITRIPLTQDDWNPVCEAASRAPGEDGLAARQFFEQWFRPFRAAGVEGDEGLFTGYFEIELRGARQNGGGNSVPIYRLPDDHVIADLGRFDATLKGRRLIGRVESGRLTPYHTRAAIDRGVLAGRDLEMLWIDDPVDVFMLHVQGSGRVVLPDGEVVRVGFAGHNGHDYASIGRELIARGELERGQASWPGIRGWITRNPERAAELFAVNPRYVFFRVIEGIPPDAGPLGAQGVPLTPGRSLAVDRRYLPLGVPLWLDTVDPGDTARPLRRLVVAQDAGGAIKGVVRGDLFWGFGAPALAQAGRMRSPGRYFLLLPKTTAAKIPQS